MTRQELSELHYIAHMNNVPSILRLGILSNKMCSKVAHTSVAMQEVQDRRAKVAVPGGRRLHEYVNLYICARNPMLYKLRGQHLDLCVLRVSTDVLDLPGTVVTDANASSNYVRFAAAPAGLSIVDRDLTFADDWRDQDPIQYFRKKSAKCAEVLVPDRVGPRFILGAYVSCPEAMNRMNGLNTGINLILNANMFFR
ncbi:MAG: DUF4433 domain-containing protein [Blastocatellia bacterium]|nr:DUF4433 domain-containing protein [Blastocatellia bacterium]